MTFAFSRHGLRGRDAVLQRAFEILPGAISWTILLGMLALSFVKPLLAAVLVIAIFFYWLVRLLYMTLFLVLSYARLSIEAKTSWMERVQGLDDLAGYLPALRQAPPEGWAARVSWWLHGRQLDTLQRGGAPWPSSASVHHVVILPVAKEQPEVLLPGLQSLAAQSFPARRILVVLAVEERGGEAIRQGAEALRERFAGAFLDCLVIVHPDGLPGEARVKGANATYAARAAHRAMTARGLAPEQAIVSCFDADTVVSQEYMACLTYHFLTSPERTQASFQPIPVYHNNIWEVPGFARVLETGSSFFQLIEATNPEQLVTFSSHSMSFKALVDVGYWPVDMISDDSSIFWKAFLHFDGRYQVVPMYVTLSMDVVSARSWLRTVRNVYRQKRRWAWGVENFPLVMRAFLTARQIPRWHRIRHAAKLLEAHVGWATWGFLLTVLGWFPALFAGREFSSSVLYYSAPRITATIFHLASLSLLISIVLSQLLLPPQRVRFKALRRIGLALEWLLVPFSATFLSALPALDAQTRLMLGRYMEFWVTEKGHRPRSRAVQGTPSLVNEHGGLR